MQHRQNMHEQKEPARQVSHLNVVSLLLVKVLYLMQDVFS